MASKALATSTYSVYHHARRHIGACGRVRRRWRAGSRAARSRCASAASPSANAASMTGSSRRCSSTTPLDDIAENRRPQPADIRRPRPRGRSSGSRIGASALAERRRRQIHLIERLHGGKTRRAPAVGAASLGRLSRFGHEVDFYFLARWRLIAISASAARAASPPLSCSVMRARAQACSSVSTVRMPLPQRQAGAATGKSDQRARRLHRNDVEMEGLASGSRSRAQPRRHRAFFLPLGGVDRDGNGWL